MSTIDQSRYAGGHWHRDLSANPGRRWAMEVLQGLAVVIDLIVASTTAVAAWLLFHGPDHFTPAFDLHLKVGGVATLSFVGFVALRGGYRINHLSDMRRQVVLAVQGWLVVFFVLAWVAFLFKASDTFSRGAVTLYFLVGGAMLASVHGVGARLLARYFATGALAHSRVVVVAVAEDGALERIAERLGRKGIEVAAASVLSPSRTGRSGSASHHKTIVGDVRNALATTRLDAVYLFVSWSDRRYIEELRATLSPLPVPIYLFADRETERLLDRPQVRMGELVGFELQRAPLTHTDLVKKRLLDLTVAGCGLVLLSPIMLLTAVAIVVESGFPILFRQDRKGFGARPFGIFKFRSMRVMENGADVAQAAKADRRVTRIGRIIRRTSIDELPQFFNVLRGDMSVVGPRPHAVAHDDLYDGLIASYAFRQHVKPGITGWAQINGCRGETREVEQMEARVEHDLWYINNWSIWLDMRIILRTAVQIFFDEQAY